MVIAQNPESSRLREQLSRLSEPTNSEGEVDAGYEQSESQKIHMGNHQVVTKHDKKRLEKDWRNKVKIADANVETKAK